MRKESNVQLAVPDELPNEQLLANEVGAILSELRNVSANYSGDASVAFVRRFVVMVSEALLSDEHFETAKIVSLARKIFHYSDMNLLLLQQFVGMMRRGKAVVEDDVKCKLANFFAALPIPVEPRVTLLDEKTLVSKNICLDWGRHCIYIQKAWLELLKIEFYSKLSRLLLPRFIETVMDHLPNCELFTDVLYRTFRIGGFMSVISLGGIFKLVVNKNFEHPNFYGEVYQIVHSNICYSNYAQKFFDLVDLIMSSSHVPAYIVCAFTKKLCRLLLFAPTHCQLPLIRLIKNLFRRHPTIHSILINRQQPLSLENDPYDEEEMDLQKCRATDSSLWELKALQWHWYDKISTKVNFVNSNVQDEEMSLGWCSTGELFKTVFERAHGVLGASSGGKGTERDARQETDELMDDENELSDATENSGTFSSRKRKSTEQENGQRAKDNLFLFDQNSLWSL
ncbi:hypothetical protein GPALN_011087 [Globodera pallida]|nr:hypothetical protein GPALN_011087 [Globodera pallida]